MKHPRVQRINKQKMYYSLFQESHTVYDLDDDGNLIPEYTDEDGNVFYRESGTTDDTFLPPVEFWASINSQLSELQAKAFGVDQSSVYSILKLSKGALGDGVNLVYGTKIWLETPIGWLNKDKRIPDESTSDFTIKGILTDRLQFDFFLLQRNNNA